LTGELIANRGFIGCRARPGWSDGQDKR
jgi:hypothetical protein